MWPCRVCQTKRSLFCCPVRAAPDQPRPRQWGEGWKVRGANKGPRTGQPMQLPQAPKKEAGPIPASVAGVPMQSPSPLSSSPKVAAAPAAIDAAASRAMMMRVADAIFRHLPASLGSSGVCLEATAILCEAMQARGMPATMVKGYARPKSRQDYAWHQHFWVRCAGQDLDVSAEVQALRNPLRRTDGDLATELPAGDFALHELPEDEFGALISKARVMDDVSTNAAAFELYQSSARGREAFWRYDRLSSVRDAVLKELRG